MPPALPELVPPMLAKLGRPFDSDRHLFEIKWDGIRASAYVEDGAYRLTSRRGYDLTRRYPELDVLRGLPRGTVLDGEIVVLAEGKADFAAVLSREQARNELRIRSLAAESPVTYVVFDLLYAGFEALLERPLHERRGALERIVADLADGRLVFSDGIVGEGLRLFEEVTRAGIEGVVAKELDSPYQPGKRTGAWTKSKPVHHLHCAILGFVPEGEGDFKSLILATSDGGALQCVGKVGTGFRQGDRRRLNSLLYGSLRSEPLIECQFAGRWVEPGLYCTVSFLERTKSGMLRGPVFVELVSE